MKAAWRNSYFRQCALIRAVSDHSDTPYHNHGSQLRAQGFPFDFPWMTGKLQYEKPLHIHPNKSIMSRTMLYVFSEFKQASSQQGNSGEVLEMSSFTEIHQPQIFF